MKTRQIAFIGGGNMASSLVGGLVVGGWPVERIHVAEPDPNRRKELTERFGVTVTTSNREAASSADVVVIAVKPQVVREVTAELATTLMERRPLLVSIAAGVRATDIQRWLGFETAIVRAMPNTPALVRSGASGLYANPQVDANGRDMAESILRAVGVVQWVGDESLMDAVTAVSGSGPAYFFLLMEIMAETGEHMGLEPAATRLMAIETAFGAAKMALESPEDPATLRARVTSPGGTTERAIQAMEAAGLRRIVRDGLEAARQRAEELGKELGGER